MRNILVLLVVAMLALVACSQTNVVKLGDQPAQPATDTSSSSSNTSSSVAPSTGGAAVATGGKMPVKCEDSDGNDPQSIGRVSVTYSDASSQDFYDDCAAGSNVEVEYFCDGNNVKSKNTICSDSCILIALKADPSKKVGMCFNSPQ